MEEGCRACQRGGLQLVSSFVAVEIVLVLVDVNVAAFVVVVRREIGGERRLLGAVVQHTFAADPIDVDTTW